jgi:tricorn protease
MIKEILARGPADKRGLGLKAGDLVLSVDGVDLDGKANLSRLLNAKKGESIPLQVLINPGADPKDPKVRRRVEIQPVDRDQIKELMYDRWVSLNAKKVGEMTGDKVGYIHIPSMDDTGLDKFVRSLYSDNFDKEAIVLDVRFNGGGNTHDQVLNYLGSKEHTIFKQRDGGIGMVLRSDDRKWTKPLVLLINGQSYSDAEIFPSAFRTLGLGKLVGQPTGGQVIGRTSIRLIDGSQFLVPRIGVFTPQGQNMEKIGVAPDFAVEVLPDHLAKGVDPQLEKAVQVVQTDVVEWKKKQSPTVVSTPEGGKPVPMPSPPGGMK